MIRGEERMPRLKFDALIEVTARVRRLVIGTPGGGVMLREQIIGKWSEEIEIAVSRNMML